MNRFADQVALVTGAGSGIGRAVARRLADEGARVVVAGRRRKPLDETVGLIRAAGGDAESVAGDVSSEPDAKRMVDETVRFHGSLSVLVNNAGIIRRGQPAAEASPADWRLILDVNLTGAWHVCRAALPRLRERRGTIVNVASTMALVSAPGTAAYQASKAGMLGLTRSMAQDYAPDVRVNAVCPGLVHTPMSYQDRPEFDEVLPDFEAILPLGRVGKPEDIAAAVAYLASAEASWITGVNLVVDGGYTLT